MRTLKLGDNGNDVCHLQRFLFATVTGVYDEPTAQRVRGWQQARGLAVTGNVDKGTLVSLEHYDPTT